MGLLGHIVGGALQGVGQGVTNMAIARRNEALEAMRARNQMERDAANDARATARDERKFEQNKELAELGYKYDVGKLAVGGKIQSDRDKTQHGYTMEEIGARHVNAKELARLESSLTQGRTEAEIKLRDKLDSGEIKSVVKGADGNYYGVTENGLVETGVAAAPDIPASASSLTEGQIEALYQDRRREWIRGGKKGPEPTRTQVITEAKGGRQNLVTPEGPTRQKGSQRATALAQLGTIYANATPERYPGLFRNGKKISLQEARRQVEQRYPE